MSTATEIRIETQSDVVQPPVRAGRRDKRAWASLAWAIVGCILLGASGGVRLIQDRRHQSEKSYKEVCPIDLDDLPEKFGDDWKMIKGGERKLDEMTMRITGGTAYKIRTYANELTGVYVTVLILFGPAEPVLPHTPRICYPATGFSADDPSALRMIEFPIGKDDASNPAVGKAAFLEETYAKPNGRQLLREAVYHSFRLDGEWSPFVGQGRKFPRRNPSIFKVQIHRLVAERESVGPGDPIEQFLQKLLAEVESRIQGAKATKTKTVAIR